jgi:hypothetical protein
MWRPRSEQPLHDALARVAERHLGASRDPRFSLAGDTVVEALAVTGFADVRKDTATFPERYKEFPARMAAMATSDTSALSEAEREKRLAAFDADCVEVLARFSMDGTFGAATFADVVSARRV